MDHEPMRNPDDSIVEQIGAFDFDDPFFTGMTRVAEPLVLTVQEDDHRFGPLLLLAPTRRDALGWCAIAQHDVRQIDFDSAYSWAKLLGLAGVAVVGKTLVVVQVPDQEAN